MDAKTLGNNLKYIRECLGYSQEEIGRYLGISQPAYLKYEKGTSTLSVTLLEKLAGLYGIDEYDILHPENNNLDTSLAFAFRKDGEIKNLEEVANFKKIVRNYIFMCNELAEG
ncbi:MAG: helix-turn-helix transcriptional regulator [Bacteroidales bacterium]|nr:helix-turn-helix transcriptional regulator [Bacteroidales bacterium]